jgi:hypothetical protein
MPGFKSLDRRVILMLSTLCLSGIVSCQSAPGPKTIERAVTVKGCTDSFIAEHDDLFRETIRLKQALQVCQEKLR